MLTIVQHKVVKTLRIVYITLAILINADISFHLPLLCALDPADEMFALSASEVAGLMRASPSSAGVSSGDARMVSVIIQ